MKIGCDLVLCVTGINKALKKAGVVDGHTVVIGDMEMSWSDDQSEAALYQAWMADRQSKGSTFTHGAARWPHAGGA